ncbi:MAG: ABC transporter permease, partial [Chloroflexota bacterium]
PTFSEEQIENLRRAWGFDRPVWEQYVIFVRKAITGDFGESIQARRPAMELVVERLGYTYLLAAASSLVGLGIAIPLGIISALNRNSVIDLISTVLASLGTAMPSFWLGLMLIIVFSVRLRMLPAFGALEPAAIIMPSVTLGVGMAARLSRLTRSSMLEVLNQDYVRTAYSKGLKKQTVVIRHALRNALIPIITVFGLQLGWLLGGSVVVESVFSWPGLGRLMIESINVRDITVVQAGLFWFALSFILINFTVDVMYALLDPRIRYD